MSQRKWTPLFVGVLLLVLLISPVIASGYSNIQKANSFWEDENYLPASESYARAAQFLVWRQDLWEKAGISAAKGGDFQNAISYLVKPPSLSEEGWVWLTTSYLQMSETEAALAACKKGLAAYDSASLYRLLAFVYRDHGDRQAERDALENQLSLNAGDAYAHYRLGLLLIMDEPDRAFDELTLASSLNPEVDSAVQTLRTALAISANEPNPSLKMLTLGRALGLVQEWELAQAAFQKAVEIDEKNAEAWAWLGEAKQQLGQNGSAELDQALALNRTSVNVRALRGLYWSRLGKYEQMLAEYLLAAEYEPENPRWRASVGEAYANLGDLTAALKAYQHAVELAPDDVLYLRLLAVFCADRGVLVEEVGLPAAQQAVSLSPNDPLALDALGFSYLSSGRFANAEQVLLESVAIAPDYFPAHIHLAITYLAQGNRAAGYNTLTFVRDADSSGVHADAAIRLLEKYFP